MFGFRFLCQFAENDGFLFHPCPYKGHELIVFDGCIVFHGVYVPHFPCLVYHRWAFGLVPKYFSYLFEFTGGGKRDRKDGLCCEKSGKHREEGLMVAQLRWMDSASKEW